MSDVKLDEFIKNLRDSLEKTKENIQKNKFKCVFGDHLNEDVIGSERYGVDSENNFKLLLSSYIRPMRLSEFLFEIPVAVEVFLSRENKEDQILCFVIKKPDKMLGFENHKLKIIWKMYPNNALTVIFNETPICIIDNFMRNIDYENI